MREYIVTMVSEKNLNEEHFFRVEAASGPGAIRAAFGQARVGMVRSYLDSVTSVVVVRA